MSTYKDVRGKILDIVEEAKSQALENGCDLSVATLHSKIEETLKNNQIPDIPVEATIAYADILRDVLDKPVNWADYEGGVRKGK